MPETTQPVLAWEWFRDHGYPWICEVEGCGAYVEHAFADLREKVIGRWIGAEVHSRHYVCAAHTRAQIIYRLDGRDTI